VELGKHLYGTDSVSEVLACIERHTGTNELPRVRLPAVMLRPVEAEMKDIRECIMSCASDTISDWHSVICQEAMKCATLTTRAA
jgi:hypothetical protein